MERPMISIVTPSFNQGEYIEEAINSVLNQGYESFEHIIIDNCSTDSTAEVIARYPHVRCISEPDKGQSDALNKGFQLARGEIIGWLNADDFYLPETLSRVEYALRSKKWSGLYSNVKFIDGEGKFLRNLNVHRPLRLMSLFHCYIPSTTFFFRAELLKKGISIDEDMHISMDKDFFANIMYSGHNLRYVNEYFASFRWHDSNKSLDNPETKLLRHKEGLKILNRYLGWNLKINSLNLALYKGVSLFFMLIRKFMKSFNRMYDLRYNSQV